MPAQDLISALQVTGSFLGPAPKVHKVETYREQVHKPWSEGTELFRSIASAGFAPAHTKGGREGLAARHRQVHTSIIALIKAFTRSCDQAANVLGSCMLQRGGYQA
jgi:hypothetical protein